MIIERLKAVVPTNDYVFKRIFGQVGNENITKDFINSILDDEIKSIDLEGNTILEKDLMDDKVGILDIKAKLDNEILCNIEMQVINHKNIEKRLMYYWSKIYISTIKRGQNYNHLKRTIAILIANFELDNLKEITKGHTKWNLRENDFSQFVLTEVCEIRIIELPKLKRLMKMNATSTKEQTLEKWVKFLLTPDEMEEVDMKNNENLKKAKEEFDEIQKDEYEQKMAELRMKHIMDAQAIEEYGYDKGLKDGREEEKVKIAKEMLKDGTKIEIIIKYTGLTKEELRKLNN